MAMTRNEVSVVMGKPCVTMVCDMKRYLYTGCSGILLSVCSWSLYIWESVHLHEVYTNIQLMYNSCTSNNKCMMTYNAQSRTKLSKSRKVVLWGPYKWPYNFQTWEAVSSVLCMSRRRKWLRRSCFIVVRKYVLSYLMALKKCSFTAFVEERTKLVLEEWHLLQWEHVHFQQHTMLLM